MRLITETGQNFSGFLGARLLFVTVLLGVSFTFRVDNQTVSQHIMLFVANVALSLGCWEWYKKSQNSKALLWFAATISVILDTILLQDIGGSNSDFVYLYFFTIGAFALLIGLAGSLAVACLSTLGMTYLLLTKHSVMLSEIQLKLFLFSVNFFFAAFILSYIFERFKIKERNHAVVLNELEQTKLDTQAILDSLSTGLVVLDKNWKVIYFNPSGSDILMIEPSEKFLDVERMFLPQNPMGTALNSIIEGKAVNGREEVEVSKGKFFKPIGLTASPFFSKENELRGYIVLFNDLTKHKELERLQRGRERLAAVGSLARELAHEIRNPLATVRGCVEVMFNAPQGKVDQKSFAELALRESDRLNDLLRDFLTFSQIDTPTKKPVQLRALIESRASGLHNKLLLNNSLSPDLKVECDEAQMSIVIDAVLLSLAEWVEKDNEILIDQMNSSKNKIRFLLRTKVIPSDYKEAVFLPFSSLHKKSKGLALATASRVIHSHGGSISLQSEVDHGTWFEIEI